MASNDSDLPLIGICGRHLPAGECFRREDAVAIQTDYTDAVARAGGLGVVLAAAELDGADTRRWLGRLDGLLLAGGTDLTPERYGAEPHPTTYGCDPRQDDFEIGLLRAALERAVPVLAICRGLQVLNVAFGGTLHQHLPEQPDLGAHGIPDGGGGTTNTFEVDEDSTLARVLGTASPSGRCHHHQAVDEVGDGLEVVARSSDGVVEGLELGTATPGPWLVAVQWHPEETAATDEANQRLFDHLVDAARH